MKVIKKIGWFLASMLPMLIFLALQFAAVYGFWFYFYLQVRADRAGSGYSDAFLWQLAAIKLLPYNLYITLVSQVAAFIIFFIWYYKVWGKKGRPQGTEKPGVKAIPVVIAAGIVLQILVSSVMNLIYMFWPGLLQSYMQMMQLAGISEITPIVMLTVVIMAPITEELLCRGLILKLAEKVSQRFWVANVIQALAFGIMHLNWVQGIYAFFLGLALGYLYGKYRNIFLCMLLHCVINFSSNFVDRIYALFPDQYGLLALIGLTVFSMAFLVLCYKLLGKVRRPDEDSIYLTWNHAAYSHRDSTDL